MYYYPKESNSERRASRDRSVYPIRLIVLFGLKVLDFCLLDLVGISSGYKVTSINLLYRFEYIQCMCSSIYRWFCYAHPSSILLIRPP